MKYSKRFLSVILALCMLLSVSLSACYAADDTGFSDVSSDAYYADAVKYVSENGIMNGTGNALFNPNGTTTRGQIAAILYRIAGTPSFTAGTDFADIDAGSYYADAVKWCSSEGIVSGYSNGNFGPNDTITREQFAAILWRYAGNPDSENAQSFTDAASVSEYAVNAVNWARSAGIINGKDGNRFDPKGSATRGQAAVILYNYINRNTDNEGNNDITSDGSHILVAYFSASGNTGSVAEKIAGTLDADTLELTPVTPYTSDDLDWTRDGSRVNLEHDNESLRDVKLTNATVENWNDYDTVFIGYPIWWGIAAWPVNDFVKSNDFTGKTVIPFCTSASSGLGSSGTLLKEAAGTGNWLEGKRFSSGASQSSIDEWLESLDF
jgi:flavodoxin